MVRVIAALIASLCAGTAGAEDLPRFLPGSWSSSTLKLVVTAQPEGLRIRASAICVPIWCEWPEIALALIAPKVESKEYTHALAVWEFGYATKMVILRPEATGLSVEAFTVFHDRSGRSNTRHLVRVMKDEIAATR